jgi:hypothetical protein
VTIGCVYMDNEYFWSHPNFHCKDLKSHCNL